MTARNPWKPRHDDGKADHRYSVRLEFNGQPKQTWVARFCDEWLGQDAVFANATALCHSHQQARLS